MEITLGMTIPFKERRRFPRHIGSLPVEVRVPTQSYPMECETTDISLGGCYIKTMFTLPVGTAVRLRVRLSDKELVINGTVKTADPGLGNGIEFGELTPGQRDDLARHLNRLNETNTEAARIIR